MIYFCLWLCVVNLIVSYVATHYRDRAARLLRERDLSRDYAGMLEQKYNAALDLVNRRLMLWHHEAEPQPDPSRKFTLLVTNGYTQDGAYVVVTVSSDRPAVLPRAMAALIVNVDQAGCEQLARQLGPPP